MVFFQNLIQHNWRFLLKGQTKGKSKARASVDPRMNTVLKKNYSKTSSTHIKREDNNLKDVCMKSRNKFYFKTGCKLHFTFLWYLPSIVYIQETINVSVWMQFNWICNKDFTSFANISLGLNEIEVKWFNSYEVKDIHVKDVLIVWRMSNIARDGEMVRFHLTRKGKKPP